MPDLTIENKHRFFEIFMVIMTGCGKFIFVDLLPHKFWFILFSLVFWVVYLILKSTRHPGILSYWGFTRQNFKSTFFLILPYAIIITVGFFIYGRITYASVINWHIIPVLILYPVWGVIQQFMVVALISGNLRDIKGKQFPILGIVLSTAIMFSIVHYPSVLLITGTFLLAIFYTLVYLKKKNLWVLGIYHGWLGGLFYFLVLGRDPFVEVFTTL